MKKLLGLYALGLTLGLVAAVAIPASAASPLPSTSIKCTASGAGVQVMSDGTVRNASWTERARVDCVPTFSPYTLTPNAVRQLAIIVEDNGSRSTATLKTTRVEVQACYTVDGAGTTCLPKKFSSYSASLYTKQVINFYNPFSGVPNTAKVRVTVSLPPHATGISGTSVYYKQTYSP